VKEELDQYSFDSRTAKSRVVEAALKEYFKSHPVERREDFDLKELSSQRLEELAKEIEEYKRNKAKEVANGVANRTGD
jgi:hypothetical protein